MSFPSVLVAGQLFNSRLETLEDYLLSRDGCDFAILGFTGPFTPEKSARLTTYRNRKKAAEIPLNIYAAKKISMRTYFHVFLSFASYILLFRKARRLLSGQTYDFYVGVATFSAFMGLYLRRAGIVREVVYYCLDFYAKPSGILQRVFHALYKACDKILVTNADYVWDISPRIPDARSEFQGLAKETYQSITVPLCVRNIEYPFVPRSKREPFSLGFVGTLSENQGLQMAFEAMPALKIQFPKIHLHIVGSGYYGDTLKALAVTLNISDVITFHGFVRDDKSANAILSKCLVGLAIWTGDQFDNSRYADPGKPKQYAMLGLPIIITEAPAVSEVIESTGAGIRIKYDAIDFQKAVAAMFDEKVYSRCILNLKKFRPYCLAQPIYDAAFASLGVRH